MFKEEINKIKKVTEFINSSDLKIITEDKNAVNKANYTKWVYRLKRWLYTLNKNSDSLKVANALVNPSYISLETVLSYNSIIPDSVTSYTSISTKTTKSFQNNYGAFYYYNLKDSLYFWYKYENGVFIAEKEKAILDYFYLKSRDLKLTLYDYNNIRKNKYTSIWCKNTFKWFKEERFENLEVLDFDKLFEYSKKFNKKVQYTTLLLDLYYKEYEQKFREIV